MLAKRIIPCLDCDLSVPNGRVVKGVQFEQIRFAGIPWEKAAEYYQNGADEICFLDITASAQRRENMMEVVRKTCEEVFVPVTVGGGIRSVEDANRVFRAGADKVSVNTAAIENPKLVSDLSEMYGCQAVVVAIDAKAHTDPVKGTWWECSRFGGRELTGLNAVEWAKKVAELGAGELLVTSMDRDGTKSGFDLELTAAMSRETGLPVIASGGAGDLESIAKVLTDGEADAALAASIFHFGEYTPNQVKQFLDKKGIRMRVQA